MNENMLKFFLNVFIFFVVVFAFILFINQIRLEFNTKTKEGLETDIILNKNNAFCESHRGSSNTLDESCSNLTQQNCTSTSCCVWTSENKCKAGDKSGPTFNSDANGKTRPFDYYYFQTKCYGPKCP
jgi:hypothetical protein